MLGEHQAENIATAIATAKVVFSQLSIVQDDDKISEAIAKTKWSARLQKISSKKIAENFLISKRKIGKIKVRFN